MMKSYQKNLLAAILLIALTSCTNIKIPDFKNYFHTDETINTAVKTAFYNDTQLNGLPIHIETHNGLVKLSGYVKTIRQSDIAAETASHISGVKSVQNDLIVKK